MVLSVNKFNWIKCNRYSS